MQGSGILPDPDNHITFIWKPPWAGNFSGFASSGGLPEFYPQWSFPHVLFTKFTTPVPKGTLLISNKGISGSRHSDAFIQGLPILPVKIRQSGAFHWITVILINGQSTGLKRKKTATTSVQVRERYFPAHGYPYLTKDLLTGIIAMAYRSTWCRQIISSCRNCQGSLWSSVHSR